MQNPELLLSVDPGASNAAWALFHWGVLVACGHEVVKSCGPSERAYRVSDDVLMAVSSAEQALPIEDSKSRQLVIECPQVYVGSKNKGDPNDLIDVAVTVGALIAVYGAFSWDLHIVKPATWKKQIPKSVCKKRLQKILSPAEQSVAVWGNHNVVDAIGIGCWKLGTFR